MSSPEMAQMTSGLDTSPTVLSEFTALHSDAVAQLHGPRLLDNVLFLVLRPWWTTAGKWTIRTEVKHLPEKRSEKGYEVSRATTVNKVTLPGRLPNVIHRTDEDLEKERAAAAAGRINVPRMPPKPTSAPINGGLPNGLVRGGVVLKSTTLNERNPLLVANKPVNTRPSPSKSVLTHPAPLPPASVGPSNPLWKAAPKPSLDIKRVANGIVLSWNMQGNLSLHADIASHQLFAYQERSDPPKVNGSVWKRVGYVIALPLPMTCTRTQFLEGHRYHFAVRAMDVHGRPGPYSEPGTTK